MLLAINCECLFINNRTWALSYTMRQKPSQKDNPKHTVARKLRSNKAEEEILALVRTGVERFVLKNAAVEDFFRTIRAVTEKERVYSHQLTRSAFSKIVKDAIKKRKLRRSK